MLDQTRAQTQRQSAAVASEINTASAKYFYKAGSTISSGIISSVVQLVPFLHSTVPFVVLEVLADYLTFRALYLVYKDPLIYLSLMSSRDGPV